ncbi:FAD:protein FMN transferase [Marinospirillum insulare]|uniref:FAD:protein FMN transferase n=1 Tax=Marinospirillum insulare TaxID=217169 RepID=A0ABQ6A0N0_9GAMM|nr:FAD:protein FMN transferase [Marinospirillum insulare]GLR64830.1 FAD:protein FMN transferase [Marinospirillum insulare]
MFKKLNLMMKLGLLLLLFTLTACTEQSTQQPVRLQGQIFGGFWLATLPDEWTGEQVKAIQAGIQGELDKVDLAMSTYKPDSELNRFNREPLNEWVQISQPLFEVLNISQSVAVASQGAFDITLGGLVNLWSFGPEARPETIPSTRLLEERLAEVGYKNLELDSANLAARRLTNSYVDLSGVAKGYAVDKVARWLEQQGVKNFLVNVGGEIIVAGYRAEEQPWRVGVEVPDGSQQTAHHILPLINNSIATSGDYRNFYEVDGQRMSHTLSPKTGWPIKHNLTSVTVIHPSNAVADAWATAFMVLGAEASLSLANQENIKVLLISKKAEGWSTQISNSLKQTLGEELTNKILH